MTAGWLDAKHQFGGGLPLLTHPSQHDNFISGLSRSVVVNACDVISCISRDVFIALIMLICAVFWYGRPMFYFYFFCMPFEAFILFVARVVLVLCLSVLYMLLYLLFLFCISCYKCYRGRDRTIIHVHTYVLNRESKRCGLGALWEY